MNTSALTSPSMKASLPSTETVGEAEARELTDVLAPLPAGERIRMLYERLGSRLVATTSFGLQAAVMLKLIHDHAPQIPVVFIDTGFLFPETYRYAETLIAQLNLDVQIYQPKISAARLQAVHGNLWEKSPAEMDQYAMLTKIEPMNRALRELGADVWLSGLRRAQSATRIDRAFVENQKRTLKAYPILDWADAQVDLYFREHHLPHHPLAAEGYLTMGDWHSTKPTIHGDAETSRFNGQKYECGLHLESNTPDFQI